MRRQPISISEILAWTDAWRARRRRWPDLYSGRVGAGPAGLTWRQVDNALSLGLRGLPGGSSLAKLLAADRGVRNVRDLAPLTAVGILSWADAHHSRTGQWPTEESGPVEGAAGEVWDNIDAALRQGTRGLPGRSSLHALLVLSGRKYGKRTRLVEELASRGRGRPPKLGRRKRVLALRRRGLSCAEIGRRLGVHGESVRQMLRRIGE